jgi:hypothetical protein
MLADYNTPIDQLYVDRCISYARFRAKKLHKNPCVVCAVRIYVVGSSSNDDAAIYSGIEELLFQDWTSCCY